MKALINLVMIFIFVSLATGQATADITWQRSIGTTSDDKLVNLILDGNKLHLGGGWGSSFQAPFSYDLRFMQIDVNGSNLSNRLPLDLSFIENDEFLIKFFVLENGNYIITGTSNEMIEGTNVQMTWKTPHVLMFEYDNNSKEIIWKEHFGGIDMDLLNVSLQTTDGNYVLGSQSNSRASGEKTEDAFGYTWDGLAKPKSKDWKEPEYTFDYWILKVSGDGGVIWEKAFGGSKNDKVQSIIETSDGGFVLAGHSNSPASSGDVDYFMLYKGAEVESDDTFLETVSSGNKDSKNHGGYDFYLVKIDKDGEKIWDKSYGGSNDDYLYFIHKAIDGGYLLGGISYSGKSGNKTTSNYGLNDYWVIKVDINGNKIWEKSFGGDGRDWLEGISKIGQEGYLLTGYSDSKMSGNKKAQNHGGYDIWATKIGKNGEYIWDNTYGGNKDDKIGGRQSGGAGVIPYFDGFILAGVSRSDGDTGTKSSKQFSGQSALDEEITLRDYWMLNIDKSGKQNFDLSFGGTGDEVFHSIVKTPDHGLILSGISNSEPTGNKTEKNIGEADIWILRYDPVIAPALITEIPDQTVNQGDELILDLELSGSKPMSIQWFKDNEILPKHKKTQLKINKTQLMDSGFYKAEISNSAGKITSNEIEVNIIGVAPTIKYLRVTGLENANVFKGEDAEIRVVLGQGTSPLEYKWFFNDEELKDKQGDRFTITQAEDDDEGVYRVEVKNDYGPTAIKETEFKLTEGINLNPTGNRIRIDPNNRSKVIFEFHAHEKGLWVVESSLDLTIWNEKACIIVGYKSGTPQAEKSLQLAKENMRTRGWSIVINSPSKIGRWLETIKDEMQFYRLKKL